MTPDPVDRHTEPCSDPNCHPEQGDGGCMAYCVNTGAHDGLDVVWLDAWNGCPFAREEGRMAEAERFQQEQYDAWMEANSR